MDASLNKELQKAGSGNSHRHRGGDPGPGLQGTSEAASAWPTPWPFSTALSCAMTRKTPSGRTGTSWSAPRATPALGVYATLAVKGFFPYEDLKTLNQPGTYLPSHCDKNKTPGVDMTTGSLGQGTSAAVGIALGDRLKGQDNRT